MLGKKNFFIKLAVIKSKVKGMYVFHLQVFERGTQAISLSVELWLHYINFYTEEYGKLEYGQEGIRGFVALFNLVDSDEFNMNHLLCVIDLNFLIYIISESLRKLLQPAVEISGQTNCGTHTFPGKKT